MEKEGPAQDLSGGPKESVGDRCRRDGRRRISLFQEDILVKVAQVGKLTGKLHTVTWTSLQKDAECEV